MNDEYKEMTLVFDYPQEAVPEGWKSASLMINFNGFTLEEDSIWSGEVHSRSIVIEDAEGNRYPIADDGEDHVTVRNTDIDVSPLWDYKLPQRQVKAIRSFLALLKTGC